MSTLIEKNMAIYTNHIKSSNNVQEVKNLLIKGNKFLELDNHPN